MTHLLYRLMCRLGYCQRYAMHNTPEGIGGRCIDCGKVHGWVSVEELRACAARMERAEDQKANCLEADFERALRSYVIPGCNGAAIAAACAVANKHRRVQ